MNRNRVLGAAASIVLSNGLMAQSLDRPEAALASGSYGPGDQVLLVGPAAFRPDDSSSSYFTDPSDGYLYRVTGQTFYWMSAPLLLPPGAEIFGLCLYALDSNPAIATVNARLDVVKMAGAGFTPAPVPVGPPTLSTTFDSGFGVVCSAPFSYVYHHTADVDGDVWTEDVVHRLRVRIQVDDESGAFGGLKILWRRQVSPAPLTATFDDVPASHPFFPFVEALAASGVTAGCGGGNFCPDSPLTRGQMAVFLAKALGMHWPF